MRVCTTDQPNQLLLDGVDPDDIRALVRAFDVLRSNRCFGVSIYPLAGPFVRQTLRSSTRSVREAGALRPEIARVFNYRRNDRKSNAANK